MSAFLAGLLTPLTTPAHALALVAFGLCAGRQQVMSWSVGAFFAGVICGLVAIGLAVRPLFALDVLLGCTFVSGGIAALAWRLPAVLTLLLGASTGLALGLDSPPQAISLAAARMTLIGTAAAAICALVLVVLAAGLLKRTGAAIAMRVLGSWCAASAMLVLAVRFSRGLPY